MPNAFTITGVLKPPSLIIQAHGARRFRQAEKVQDQKAHSETGAVVRGEEHSKARELHESRKVPE